MFPSALLLSPAGTFSKIFEDSSRFQPEQITTSWEYWPARQARRPAWSLPLDEFGKNWNSADAQGLTPEDLKYDQGEAFEPGLIHRNARFLQMLRDALFLKAQACSARMQLLHGSLLSTEIENARQGSYVLQTGLPSPGRSQPCGRGRLSIVRLVVKTLRFMAVFWLTSLTSFRTPMLPRVILMFCDHPHLLALFNWHSCRCDGALHVYFVGIVSRSDIRMVMHAFRYAIVASCAPP